MSGRCRKLLIPEYRFAVSWDAVDIRKLLFKNRRGNRGFEERITDKKSGFVTEMSESGVAKPTNLEDKGDEKNGKLVCSAGFYRKRRSYESYVPENDLT